MSTAIAANTATATDPYAALAAASTTGTQSKNEAGSADRFLKLLVTQMQNQDPLNPTDNAQITSQMAQINTVSGIDTLNTTVKGLNAQFVQMQALQGASLVGHDVTLEGSRMAVENGSGVGGFELAGTADQVKVEITTPAGRVVKTLDLGTLQSGRHAFNWDAEGIPDNADYRFKVTATAGTQKVDSTPLMRDHVLAVSTSGNGLLLQTRNSGDVAYSSVKAVN